MFPLFVAILKFCSTMHIFILPRLSDDSVKVRQTTVTVLTHLILNDMVKVKGQISEMAFCLEDQERRIADLAKLFFTEFSQKVNKHSFYVSTF